MMEALHAGALLPATVGLCCTALERRRLSQTAADGVPAAVMTMAMADAAAGSVVLAPVEWTLLLLFTSILPAVSYRWRRRGGDRGSRHDGAMAVHRSIGALVMSGLMLVMGVPAIAPLAGEAAAHQHGGFAGGLVWMLLASTIVFVLFSVWLVSASGRGRRAVVVRVEVVAMALSSSAVAAALLM